MKNRCIYPVNGTVVSILTEDQHQFIADGRSPEALGDLDWHHPQRSADYDRSLSRVLLLEFESDAYKAEISISEQPDFPDEKGKTLKITAKNNTAEVHNLCQNTHYYWKVNNSAAADFFTADEAPRCITAGNLTNVRDCGAWRTKDGRHVRQKILYRGCELEFGRPATEEALRVLREDLGIRTDLDLREEATGKIFSSAIGPDVRFCLLPISAYNGFTEPEEGMFRDNISKIFSLLADRSVYPVYFHCAGGADRTGTLQFMLGAILGISLDDMLLDYEFTTLSQYGTRSRIAEYFRPMIEKLQSFGTPEDSIPEKALLFLKSVGVTEETMNSIREILLEDAPAADGDK